MNEGLAILRPTRKAAVIGKRKRTPSGEVYRVRRVGSERIVDVRPEDLDHLIEFRGYCCTGNKKTPLFEVMGPTPDEPDQEVGQPQAVPQDVPQEVPQDGRAILVPTLHWGLGDVLCSTAAIRQLRLENPGAQILYRTNVKGRRPLEYDQGGGASPDEMLFHNPYIDEIVDVMDKPARYSREMVISYAGYEMPSLDEPLQARMFDSLGLDRPADGRYDADYYLVEEEVEWAQELLRGEGRYCFVQPRCGWPGKQWNDRGWRSVIGGIIDMGWVPIIGSGLRLNGAPWSWGVNLSGDMDIRRTAAIVSLCKGMIGIEGGISNLRFALGMPAVILTCATKFGVQVWAPPELLTEVRAKPDCEPCMWRAPHLAGGSEGPPAILSKCPKGTSLRDVKGKTVMKVLEKHLKKVK